MYRAKNEKWNFRKLSAKIPIDSKIGYKINNVPHSPRLHRRQGTAVLCIDEIDDVDWVMCLNEGVFHNRDIGIVRMPSGHWVYGESGLTCKRILFRIRGIFHLFGQDVAWYEFPNSQHGKKSFRNEDTLSSRPGDHDELSDDGGVNAQFYILYRNSVQGICTIDLKIIVETEM